MKAPRELLPIEGRRCVAVGGRVPCAFCGTAFLAVCWFYKRLEAEGACQSCTEDADVGEGMADGVQ